MKVKLKDIAAFSKGSQINGSDLIDEAPYIYINGGINPSGRWNDYNVEAGTVTISEGGNSCGYVNFINEPFWCGAHCYYLYNIDGNKKYLYYALKSQENRLMGLRSGACMPNIKKNDLGEFSFVYESDLKKQKDIVNKFDNLENCIFLAKKELEKMELLIKSRFIGMFGDPVKNPMNWDMKRLSELSNKIMNGNTPKGGSKVYVDRGIVFFRSQNVWKNRLIMDDIAHIDEKTHASMKESSLKDGDILITKTGRINTENSSLGRAALYLGDDDVANINGHVYLVRLKKGISRQFVLNILISDIYREYIRSVCVGGIDKRQLNRNHIEDFPIIQPPIGLQSEFEDFVQNIGKLKLAVKENLEKLEILKKALMQQYFG